MDRTYTKFSDLREGRFYPHGVHCANYYVVTYQGDRKIVVGSKNGRVALREGDTLIYEDGKVWFSQNPDNFSDPIRRVMGKADVPVSQKFLSYSNKPVLYVRSHEHEMSILQKFADECPHGDMETGELASIKGSNFMHTTVASDTLEMHESCHQIVNAEAVVIWRVVGREVAPKRTRKVSRIIVRQVEKKNRAAWRAEVAEWLVEELANSKV